MTFSYSAIWDDCVRLLKAHGSLLIAVAGVFLLLPELLISYFLPGPEPTTIQQMIELGSAYIRDNWGALALATLISSTGAIAMFQLLLGRGGLSVGGAIGGAMPLLIPYVLTSMLSNILIFGGLSLLIVPGLYLIGRTAVAGAALVAENKRNPIEAMRRSFGLTKGRGWAVVGLLVIIFVTGSLVVFASSRVLGSIFLLTAGPRLGGVLALILDAALGAGLTMVTLVLTAAIYRRLAGQA